MSTTITARPSGDLLTTDEAPGYLLDEYRLRRGKRRMALLRGTGEGPKYLRVGNQVLYPRHELDSWALRLLGRPMASTSEEVTRGRLSPKKKPGPR
jgi:hypothetical protein